MAISILVVLTVAGLALRVVATTAWWPAGVTGGDPLAYVFFASGRPLDNPFHPAGYSLFLAFLGIFTRSIATYVILQHLLAVGAAFVLFAGVRRLCGSPWPGVVAAAVVLLGADQIYLEHGLRSEALFMPLLAVTVYATARVLDAPERCWPWPAILGVTSAAASVTRSAGLFLLPVLALALWLAIPKGDSARGRRVATFLGVAGLFLAAYGSANAVSHDRFHVTSATGLHLYGRVAPFASCGEFDPPRGTAELCERTDPAGRAGPDWYMFTGDSPASKLTGFPQRWENWSRESLLEASRTVMEAEGRLAAFGQRAILNQPRTYLTEVLEDARAYFFPGDLDHTPGRGHDLDPSLSWRTPLDVLPVSSLRPERGMRFLFDPFTVQRNRGHLIFLHDYQRIFRFGATALTIATLLTIVGLFVGPRRNRISAFVLGGGGLAMLLMPTFSIIYVARYTVPVSALMAAAGAVSAMSIAQMLVARVSRQAPKG